MTDLAPSIPSEPTRISVDRYLDAAAGIPEYWIVNLRDEVVEVMREPERAQARYRAVRSAARGERLELAALPGAGLDAAELLPSASRSR